MSMKPCFQEKRKSQSPVDWNREIRLATTFWKSSVARWLTASSASFYLHETGLSPAEKTKYASWSAFYPWEIIENFIAIIFLVQFDLPNHVKEETHTCLHHGSPHRYWSSTLGLSHHLTSLISMTRPNPIVFVVKTMLNIVVENDAQ